MKKEAMIRARTDEITKAKVESIFEQLGLNTSQAINLFFKNVILHHGLPFEVKVPNKITLKTFESTDSGQNTNFAQDAGDLFKKLGI